MRLESSKSIVCHKGTRTEHNFVVNVLRIWPWAVPVATANHSQEYRVTVASAA